MKSLRSSAIENMSKSEMSMIKDFCKTIDDSPKINDNKNEQDSQKK